MTARNFSNQLSGQIGEALVVAELGRLGIVATAFAGNVPDIDILAYKEGKSTAVQVKAWKTGSVSFDASGALVLSDECPPMIPMQWGFDGKIGERLIDVSVKRRKYIRYHNRYVFRH